MTHFVDKLSANDKYDAPSAHKVSAARCVEPFNMFYVQCVEHAKTTTLTFIGFKTLIGVHNPNPKQYFVPPPLFGWSMGRRPV